MSLRCQTGTALWASLYQGLGPTGQQIIDASSSGTHGGGPLANDSLVPSSEYILEIVQQLPGNILVIDELGRATTTEALPDGTHTWSYLLKEDGAYASMTPTVVTIQVGPQSVIVGSDLNGSYGVASLVGSDFSSNFAVNALVGQSFTASFDTLVTTGQNFESSFGVTESVGTELAGTYSFVESVGMSLSGSYFVLGLTESSTTALRSTMVEAPARAQRVIALTRLERSPQQLTPKVAGETLRVVFELRKVTTIISGTPTLRISLHRGKQDPAIDAMLAETPVVDGSKVRVLIEGGIPGNVYLLRLVYSDGEQTLFQDAILPVR